MPKIQPELSFVNITIDKKLQKPLYQQLYENIRNEILSGRIRAGERLPATRHLAEQLGISRNIVSLSFEQLTLEGYLTGKVGAGTFVSSTLPDNYLKSAPTPESGAEKKNSKAPFNLNVRTGKASSRNSAFEPIVPFQNAVPALDLFPFKIWNKIVARTYKQINSFHLGYSEAAGYAPLRESIANYVRTSRGVRCDADQIVIINGAQQGFSLCSHIFLDKGDEVLVEDPGYFGARSAFLNYGAKLCPVPVEKDGIDMNYIKKHYKKPKLAYITPAHHYPLGGTLSLTKRMDLLKWASNNNTWILEDDYDSELRYTGRPLASLQGLDQHNKVIYIGTFSKVVFPALRIAYLVLPTKEMAQHFANIKAVFDRQLPIMEQAIMNSFIEEGHFIRHLRKMRLAYHDRQKMLIKAVGKDLPEKLQVDEQAAGMHLIGWLKKSENDREVSSRLATHGILANPLSDYCLKFQQKPAIILGYTAFNKFRLRHFVQKMDSCL